MQYRIGEYVQVAVGDLIVYCQILDIKKSYGKIRYRITPAAGDGAKWIEIQNIRAQENTYIRQISLLTEQEILTHDNSNAIIKE